MFYITIVNDTTNAEQFYVALQLHSLHYIHLLTQEPKAIWYTVHTTVL